MYDQPILCLAPASDGEPVLLSKALDRPVASPRWDKEGNNIAVLVTDDCERYIASYTAGDGKMNKIIGVTVHSIHWNGIPMAAGSLP